MNGLQAERQPMLLLETLAGLRDQGRPFPVTTSTGRSVVVQPFKV